MRTVSPAPSVKQERPAPVVRPTPASTAVERASNGVVVIAVDAGHGGKDPGAIGPRVNISISKEICYMTKRNVKYTLLSGVLTYLPDVCPVCGSVNENCSIIKHGTKSSDIKLLPCNGNPTYLRLKATFSLQGCGSTFSAKTDLVDTNCYISKQVKLHIIDNLRLKIAQKRTLLT